MRRRKTDLTARVNGNLQLEFGDVALTSYAGLELFGRYLRMMGFNRLVREAFSGRGGWTDFGVVAMVRLLIGLLVVGGRRVRHLGFVQGDPVFERFCGLQRLPSARTVGRWLRQFTMETVGRLQSLNGAVIAHVVPGLGLRTLTVDVDGVVVSTGQQVERAFRGYNPHHRKVPSYYPITAHLAETTHVLRVKNRSGNVHDGKAGLPFLRDLWAQMIPLIGQGGKVRFRMDGAFFRQDVLRWLQARRAGYAIKVPFYHWLDLQQYIRAQPKWVRVAPDVTGFVVPAAKTPWQAPVWVAIYRKKVRHRATKNFQLDLFDPNDGHYEYSANQQYGFHAFKPLVFHVRSRQPRKNNCAAQNRPRVSYRPNDGLWCQQRLAAVRGTCAQFAHKLPDRYRSCSSQALPEANRSARSAEHSDFALCAPESCRRTRPPQRRDEAAPDEQ